MVTQELYHAQDVAANTTTDFEGQGIGGFICVTGGTISVVNRRTGTVFLQPFTVTAGAVYGLAIFTGTNGYRVILAGGASGTVLKA